MKPTVEDIKACGGYSIVYADPPWQYQQGGRGAATEHYDTLSHEKLRALPVRQLMAKDAVLFLWATMPLLPDAIELGESWCGEMAYKTCAFTWIKHHEPSGKPAMGGGMWTRSNAELCLLFVRGTPPRRVSKAVRQLVEEGHPTCSYCEHAQRSHTDGYRCEECQKDPPIHGDRGPVPCHEYEPREQVLRAPRGAHSAKPPEVRKRIDELMGDPLAPGALTRVELFARQRAPGWDCWGAEAEGGSDFVMGGVG